MYDYVDNQIDLSILRYLKQQEKEFSKEDINRREEFYRQLNRRSEIDQKLNGLLQPWLRLYEESIYLMWLFIDVCSKKCNWNC
jgi:arginyl-tRNA synthetase